MLTFPFNWFTVATSESLVTSLAAGGVKGVVRNHGYRNQNFSAALTRQGHDLMSVGVRRLPTKGRISSLLCLCGISVSVLVYLLYSKFFHPRSYYSAILTKLVRRLLLRRNRERLGSLRTKRTVGFSNSTSGELPNDDDVSKTTESPCPSVRASSISSSRVVTNCEDDIGVPPSSSQPNCPSSGRPSAGGSTRRRPSRRRTLSESLDVPRLDEFVCLFPGIVREPKYLSHGTRNVIDWLAQMTVDIDGGSAAGHEEDRFLEDVQDGEGGCSGGEKKAALVRRSVGCAPCDGCLSDLDAGIEAIVVRTLFESEDARKGLDVRGSRDDNTESVKEEEEEEEEEGRGQGPRKSGASLRTESPVRNNWIGGRAEENEGETVDSFHPTEDTNTPSKVFYFEDEDDEEDEFTSGAHCAPLHPGVQPPFTGQQQRRQHQQHQQQHQQQQHDTLTPLNRLAHPDDPTHLGGPGYEWLRARLLGSTRKRRTSTGASLDLLAAAQGLTRNHFSFNSELSAASSDYTYRESLVSKGLSVDGGEDLDRLVIPGDDLLWAADLSRWTLTNIDQLHEELENIRRDISDINSEVEVLQSREDLTDFTSRYDISCVSPEEERRNSSGYHSNTDLRMLGSSSSMLSQRRRRSRSVSSIPQADFDPEEGGGFRGCELDDLNLHSAQGDGFAWDYDPGLTLTPTPTNYALRRVSNTFRLDESEVLRSDQERHFVFHNEEEEEEEEEEDCADWDEQLSRSSLSDCDDDPVVISAEHPVAEYSNATDDEYIDDGYEVLTRFQR